MGLFGKRKDKKKKKQAESNNASTIATPSAPPGNDVVNEAPRQSSKPKSKPRTASTFVEEPTLDLVPRYRATLQETTDPSGDAPAKALSSLFTLSETPAHRIALANEVTPTLLEFVQRTPRGSSAQYLVLLVVNNICIPSENKRYVALECGGASIISQLLREDPSCHLLAIILVNLTFCDLRTRQEWVQNDEWMDCLVYALRVASFSHEQYNLWEQSGHIFTTRELFQGPFHYVVPDGSDQVFKETARWACSALKNLTRPSSSSTQHKTLASSFLNVQMLELLLQFITVKTEPEANGPYQEYSGSSGESPALADPEEGGQNLPHLWESNSLQDAALYCIMNLTIMAPCRSVLRQVDAINVLLSIADYPGQCDTKTQVEQFQSLKARMALSYLLGSEGHFGQRRIRSTAATDTYTKMDGSALSLGDYDTNLLIELLANTLTHSGKDGPGGYSAATFNVKWVLYAIRCLVTYDLNQVKFAQNVRLNVLLLKVLALHAIQDKFDAEAAEYACFSLYLQSNYGFQKLFLPAMFGNQDNIAGTGSLIAKILTSYVHLENITSAGRHAADQLLLRLRYLKFAGSMSELTSPKRKSHYPTAAFAFDEELLQSTESIIIEKRRHGARPRPEIFDRAILRSKAPKRGNYLGNWDNSSVATFPNALKAVQPLSFGSVKVRHVDALDDILIANNIVCNANGEKTESYNYRWSWQDPAENEGGLLGKARAGSPAGSMFSNISSYPDEPLSIFGIRCGPLCSSDKTEP